jgi:SAM-dependent methyltransferase
MPGLPPEYYRDYDFLHKDKHYAYEADVVLQIGRNITGIRPRKILEVGCGTGNHTQRFASCSANVTAVDIDLEMTRIANAKNIASAEIIHGTLGKVPARDFDLACAMFNVINYVDDESELIALFRGVRERLGRDSVFVFDCWNGEVVKRDPPANFERTVSKSNNDWLTVKATGGLDITGDFAEVDYTIAGIRYGSTTEYKYTIRSKLWSLITIEKLLNHVGFTQVTALSWMEPNIVAAPDSWKIILTAHS